MGYRAAPILVLFTHGDGSEDRGAPVDEEELLTEAESA